MKIIDQDILEVESGCILHQVNCQAKMGAGLALAIAQKWPEVKKQYGLFCQSLSKVRLLGEAHPVNVDKNLIVVNLFGQFNYGAGEKQTSYPALAIALGKCALRYKTEKIYIPYKMGCGLAGGDWDIVSNLIEIILPQAYICRI